MKVLLVEDDGKSAGMVARGLREEGFVVDVACDGDVGLDEALHGGSDIVILDVWLPGLDGWDVLRGMRARGCDKPVVMLTARDALEDKIKGLALGADDYVVKPFALAELVARTRAVLRRKGPAPTEPLVYADLVHDARHGITRRGETEIELTAKESQLLELLLLHQGEVLSRSYIVERIWEMSFDGDSNFVDTSIWRLRSKVDGKFDRALIHTVRGRGYVLR